MPSITEQTTIPSPPETVWPLLSDPALIASCIPGAELAPDQGDGLWRGSIRVKFGPTVATFRGEAELTYDHAARTCSIEGRGIDQRGASHALASGTVTASGEAETVLNVEGSFTVTGPLEGFANAGGVHVARALLAEFSGNLARLAAERGGATAETGAGSPVPDAPAAAPAPARELSAAGLLWRAFKSWLGSLFGGKT
ncbi:MAG: SRPBCC family protein [Thalassobaculum sp.]|uniref:SRPBCC family protein n=1 Tax=Thalassobaculum sp. TaxID=2022740 RepID=UPI0032EC2696